ncbi:amidase [Dongia soli]|uniref:Amidase family protein n=1 Tax=Dongia soli TaxID=600628 RepID=A0ABU5E855_9PROT|nr:amidase family protein [Dongia soli]MDY0882383.1 amidase family protein [Dongia soli]
MAIALDLYRLTAVAAVAALRRGEVTPLDLIDAAEARIAATNSAVNAIVTLCLDRARAAARELMAKPIEARGLLCGLPLAVKDLSDVAGVRTTYGSPIFKDHVPNRSDPMVERLESNGAIVIGMSNSPEFGAGGNTFNEVFGETRNPWNTALNAGGSSGGAAAALAAGQVWLATGSDLGGSLRTPASFCSVVGLRPSPGRVARNPGEIRFDTMSVEGPMARNVADVAVMLDAMVGYDEADPISLPAPAESFLAAAQNGRLPRRVAISADLGITPVEPETRAVLAAAADKLRAAGVEVVEACPDFAGVPTAFQTLRAVDYAASMRPLLERYREHLKPDVIWNIEKGLELTVEQIGQATRRRSRLYAEMVAFFKEYDLLIAPAACTPPRDIKERWMRKVAGVEMENYVDWLKIASVVTVSSCPALALPAGFTPDGRPVGLQLVARPRGEAALLGAAAAIESLFGLAGQVPLDPREG